MAQEARQLPGDAANVHRRMDNAEFYPVNIPPSALPPAPAGIVPNTEEWREWRALNIELIQARQILDVQLAPPHRTPENLRLAWNFWWRVATQHEHARNAHAFTYHGMRRADGENAEGIPELVRNLPLRIRALEQRVAARNARDAPGFRNVMRPAEQYTPQQFVWRAHLPVQRDAAVGNFARPAVPAAGGPGSRSMAAHPYQPAAHPYQPVTHPYQPFAHPYQPATPSNLNSQAQQNAYPRPYPEYYPPLQHHMSTDSRAGQPQRPPFSRPRHAVFWYWARDLGGNVVLPVLPDGRNLFVRSRTDQTDRGWGPGVTIHDDVREEVTAADEEHTSGLVAGDRGPPAPS